MAARPCAAIPCRGLHSRVCAQNEIPACRCPQGLLPSADTASVKTSNCVLAAAVLCHQATCCTWPLDHTDSVPCAPLCPSCTAVFQICGVSVCRLAFCCDSLPAWSMYLTSPQHRFSALQSWGTAWSYAPSRQVESSTALTVHQPAAAGVPVLAALGQPAPCRIG